MKKTLFLALLAMLTLPAMHPGSLSPVVLKNRMLIRVMLWRGFKKP